jgi:hypothetical protein
MSCDQLLLWLRGPKRAAQKPGPKFRVSTPAGGVASPGNKQEMDHPSSPAVRRQSKPIRNVNTDEEHLRKIVSIRESSDFKKGIVVCSNRGSDKSVFETTTQKVNH